MTRNWTCIICPNGCQLLTIPAIMQLIRELRLTAPVAAGEVVLPAVLGLDSDVIAARTVDRV